jgi:hypothetical protein
VFVLALIRCMVVFCRGSTIYLPQLLLKFDCPPSIKKPIELTRLFVCPNKFVLDGGFLHVAHMRQ